LEGEQVSGDKVASMLLRGLGAPPLPQLGDSNAIVPAGVALDQAASPAEQNSAMFKEVLAADLGFEGAQKFLKTASSKKPIRLHNAYKAVFEKVWEWAEAASDDMTPLRDIMGIVGEAVRCSLVDAMLCFIRARCTRVPLPHNFKTDADGYAHMHTYIHTRMHAVVPRRRMRVAAFGVARTCYRDVCR
jgi:hypothetical protein